MVPYVRKSFYKHFKDGLKYCEGYDGEYIMFNVEETPIESETYKKHEKAYRYAMDMTLKETHQAVEGMYHNLKVFGRHNSNIMNIAA